MSDFYEIRANASIAVLASLSSIIVDGSVYQPDKDDSDFEATTEAIAYESWFRRKDTGIFWQYGGGPMDREEHDGPFRLITTYDQRLAREALHRGTALAKLLCPGASP